jgi:hypothetical protein
VDMRSNVLQDRDVEANIFNHVELWHATSWNRHWTSERKI